MQEKSVANITMCTEKVVLNLNAWLFTHRHTAGGWYLEGQCKFIVIEGGVLLCFIFFFLRGSRHITQAFKATLPLKQCLCSHLEFEGLRWSCIALWFSCQTTIIWWTANQKYAVTGTRHMFLPGFQREGPLVNAKYFRSRHLKGLRQDLCWVCPYKHSSCYSFIRV